MISSLYSQHFDVTGKALPSIYTQAHTKDVSSVYSKWHLTPEFPMSRYAWVPVQPFMFSPLFFAMEKPFYTRELEALNGYEGMPLGTRTFERDNYLYWSIVALKALVRMNHYVFQKNQLRPGRSRSRYSAYRFADSNAVRDAKQDFRTAMNYRRERRGLTTSLKAMSPAERVLFSWVSYLNSLVTQPSGMSLLVSSCVEDYVNRVLLHLGYSAASDVHYGLGILRSVVNETLQYHYMDGMKLGSSCNDGAITKVYLAMFSTGGSDGALRCLQPVESISKLPSPLSKASSIMSLIATGR